MNKLVSVLLRVAAMTVLFDLGTLYGITVDGGILAYVLWAVALEAIFWTIGTIIGAVTNGMDKEARGAIVIWTFPFIMFALIYAFTLCPTFHVAGVFSAFAFSMAIWFVSGLLFRSWGNKAVE
jgi:hypothetical protein